MQKSRNAFSMIELVFVIVILGILAAVAIPKFAATRTDAQISKGRADIASVRSAIVNERQTRLIKGSSSYIPNGTTTYDIGSTTYKHMDNGGLFGGVLMYAIAESASGDDGWSATDGSGTYDFTISGTTTTFTYNDTTGIFACTAGSDYCDELVN